jgi:flavin reductase (DIM6/NTAB) family NADH-FMN oxidoreductase RutF
MRQPVDWSAHYPAVMRALTSRGLLLGSRAPDGRPNVMTIGWGTLGVTWGLPMWVVLVRPSRHTFACLEHGRAFTVNVPPPALAAACDDCGSLSGRDTDKFTRCRLTAETCAVDAPAIAECPLVYECQVVHTLDVLPERLAKKIQSGAYRSGDYHRVYFGEIVVTRAEPDAAARLA